MLNDKSEQQELPFLDPHKLNVLRCNNVKQTPLFFQSRENTDDEKEDKDPVDDVEVDLYWPLSLFSQNSTAFPNIRSTQKPSFPPKAQRNLQCDDDIPLNVTCELFSAEMNLLQMPSFASPGGYVCKKFELPNQRTISDTITKSPSSDSFESHVCQNLELSNQHSISDIYDKSTLKYPFKNYFRDSLNFLEIDNEMTSLMGKSNDAQSLTSVQSNIDHTLDRSLVQFNKISTSPSNQVIEINPQLITPQTSLKEFPSSVISSHVIFSPANVNDNFKFTRCRAVQSLSNLTTTQNSLMTVNTCSVNSFNNKFKFPRGSKLFLDDGLDQKFGYVFDIGRRKSFPVIQEKGTNNFQLLRTDESLLFDNILKSEPPSTNCVEFDSNKFLTDLSRIKGLSKLQASKKCISNGSCQPSTNHEVLEDSCKKVTNSNNDECTECREECAEFLSSVSGIEIRRTEEKCDLRVSESNPEKAKEVIENKGVDDGNSVFRIDDNDSDEEEVYFEDFGYDIDLEDDSSESDESIDRMEQSTKNETSSVRELEIASIPSTVLDRLNPAEPVLVNCIDEKTQQFKDLLLCSDDFYKHVLSEHSEDTPRSKILELLLQRSKSQEGKPFHVLFDARNTVEDMKTNDARSCGVMHLQQEPIEPKMKAMLEQKELDPEEMLLHQEAEPVEHRKLSDFFTDSLHDNEIHLQDLADVYSVLSELVGKVDQSELDRDSESQRTPQEVTEKASDIVQAKPKLKVRRLRRKKSRTALKRVNMDEIISNVFRKFFQTYSKLGGRLKSGAVITKTNSNYWLKKAGIVDDSLSLRMASDNFVTFARSKVVLNISDYVQYLIKIAHRKRMIVMDLVQQLVMCKPPSLSQLSKHKANTTKRCITMNFEVPKEKRHFVDGYVKQTHFTTNVKLVETTAAT